MLEPDLGPDADAAPDAEPDGERPARRWRGRERRRGDRGRPGGLPDRRRPGRFRRWILRPFVWFLLLLVVALSGALWYVYRPAFQRQLLERFVPRVSEYLGREVTVGQLRYSLFPLWVELRDVKVGGPRKGDPPIATARRIYVQAELRRLRGPVLRLETVQAEGVQIWLHRFLDGSDNWPHPKSSGMGSKRPWELDISSFTVSDAVFRYREESVPLDLEAGRVHVALLGMGGTDVQGRAVAESVAIKLPHTNVYRAGVAAKIAVHRDGLEIVSARANSPEATLAARGVVRWRGDKRVELKINGSVAADLFERLGYIGDEVNGWLQVDGSFAWKPDVWGWRGVARSSRLRALDWELTGVEAALKGDGGSISADIERAAYGGGQVSGWVQVGLGGDAPRTRLQLQLQGIDAEKFLDDSRIPVGDLASRLGGTVDYRFRAGDWQHGDGSAELRVTPDPRQGHGLAVGGTVSAVLARGVLTTPPVRLVAPGQTIDGAARYELPRQVGSIDYVLASTDLQPLVPAIPVPPGPGGQPPLWLPTRGSGQISGTLKLQPDRVSTDMRLDLTAAVARGIAADRAQGALTLSGEALESLHLELARGKSAAIVDGRVGFAPGAPWQIALDVARWPAEDAQPWLDFALPVQGPFTGSVTLAGKGRSASGALDGEVDGGKLEELAVDRLRASLRWDDQALHVLQARVVTPAGEASAEGSMALPGHQLEMTVATSGLDLAKPPLAGSLGGITGALSFAGTLAGTLEKPALRGEAVGERLALGGRPLGENGRAVLRLDWNGEQVQADGSVLGLAQLSGGGHLDTQRADLTFQVRADDLAALRGFAPAEADLPQWSGHARGELRVTGALAAPELTLRLDEFGATVGQTPLVAREPIRLRLAGGRLRFDSLYVSTPDRESEVVVAGSMGTSGDAPLDLRVQGVVDNGWLAPLLPKLTLSGKSDVLATVRGTLQAPRPSGQATLRPGAELSASALPEPVRDLQATVLFYPDRLVIDRAEGTFAGGSLQATGTVEWPRGQQPLSARLQVLARRVSLRYPEDWQLRGDADVVWTLQGDDQAVRGVVTLDRALYLRDVDLGLVQLLQRFFRKQRQEVGVADEALGGVQLNVQVRAPGSVRIKNNLADLKGSAELTFRGSLARPVLFGRVEAEPGGRLVYADNSYRLERGTLTFANPYRIEPLVDVVATTRVSQYDVHMALFGNVDRLNATFTSDPPLPDLEVVSLLLSGTPDRLSDELTQMQRNTEQQPANSGAEALLLGQAASLVTQRVGNLFGFDAFKIQPLARSSSDSVSSARVSVGKRIARNVYVTYSYDPSATGGQRLQVEWQVSSGFSVLLTQEQNAYAVDVLWETRF